VAPARVPFSVAASTFFTTSFSLITTARPVRSGG
jgi:hypothetical protein